MDLATGTKFILTLRFERFPLGLACLSFAFNPFVCLGSHAIFCMVTSLAPSRRPAPFADWDPVVESHCKDICALRGCFLPAWPSACSCFCCFLFVWLHVIGKRPFARASARLVSAELFGSGRGWSCTPFAWKKIASLVWRQKWVTG